MSIKYLGFDVPVLLKDGTTRLSQNLKDSDVLLSSQSNSTYIHKVEIVIDDIYKVIPRYGSTFSIGSNNKIDKELKKTYIEFPLKSIKIDPYFIGLCLANNNYKNDEIIFKIDDTHEEIYNYLISMITKTNIKYIIENGFFKITDSRIIDYFRFYGLYLDRIIPEIYKYNKINFRYRLLGGILDAKGNYFNNSYYEFADHEDLVKDVDYVAKSVGLYTNMYKKNDMFIVHIFGANISNIQSFKTKIEKSINPEYDYKVAPVLFDNRCVKLSIIGEHIVLSDFTII